MATCEREELAAIREAAAAWVVRLADEREETGEGDAGGEAQRDSQAWLRADPRHQETFRQIRLMWDALEQPLPRATPARRPLLLGAASLLGLCLLFLGHGQHWLADERSGIGEVRQLTLTDGSRLTLDSGSAVDLDFSGTERRVRLLAGRVLAQVAHDPAGRPFRVVSEEGTAQALGTRYVVDRSGDGTLVSVIESSVAVRAARGGASVTLGPGQALRLGSGGTAEPLAAAPAADSWERHRLIFDNAPLDEVLAQLNRYFPGHLHASGDDLARLRFTGALPADDVDKALRLLAEVLPLRVERHSRWLIRVRT